MRKAINVIITFFILDLFLLFYVYDCFDHVHAWYLERSEKNILIPWNLSLFAGGGGGFLAVVLFYWVLCFVFVIFFKKSSLFNPYALELTMYIREVRVELTHRDLPLSPQYWD